MICFTSFQRKYVQEVENPRAIKNFYSSFKEWKKDNFSDDEIDWQQIASEDANRDYNPDPDPSTLFDHDQESVEIDGTTTSPCTEIINDDDLSGSSSMQLQPQYSFTGV